MRKTAYALLLAAPIPVPKRKTYAEPENKAFTRRPTNSLRRRIRTATAF